MRGFLLVPACLKSLVQTHQRYERISEGFTWNWACRFQGHFGIAGLPAGNIPPNFLCIIRLPPFHVPIYMQLQLAYGSLVLLDLTAASMSHLQLF